MKKLLQFAAFAPLAALAVEVQSSNTMGVVKITSSLTNTVIAQPYEALGGTEMKVTDFVVTKSGLKPGDILYYFVKGSGSTEDSLSYWVLDSKYTWSAATVVAEAGSGALEADSAATVGAAEAPAIARGSAVIVSRQKPVYTSEDEGKTAGDAIPFYIYGQVKEGTIEQTITAGRNLIAYPHAEALSLNEKLATGPAVGDRIRIPQANGWYIDYYYMNNPSGATASDPDWYSESWDSEQEKVVYSTECSIPAGQGFWYLRKANTESFTVEW